MRRWHLALLSTLSAVACYGVFVLSDAWLADPLGGKFSLTAGKRESIKIILSIIQYLSEARWATYLHLMSNYTRRTIPWPRTRFEG